jgi:hypothetical protein
MSNTLICFLVINKMEKLPQIAIESAFNTTSGDICIGYLRKEDLPKLPSSPRIKYAQLDLLGFESDSTQTYQSFSEDSFYQIVQYKWSLLNHVLQLDYQYVIYSDTDVFWNLDPIQEIEATFALLSKVNVQIQSFTDSLNQPRLCMGFVAFRNNDETRDFIHLCKERHKSDALQMEKVGDDDVVTRLYVEMERPNSIIELPQTTFPVGRMIKLFALNSLYPGLASPTPYIFHANYVIGLKNKILLIRIFIAKYSQSSHRKQLSFVSYVALILKHFRHLLTRIKNSFK